MLKTFALIAATSLMSVGLASAQTKDELVWNPDGSLTISAWVQKPTPCHTVGKPTVGTPTGERPIQNALALAVPIYTSGGICAQVVTPERFKTTVKVPAGTQAVILYTTYPGYGIAPSQRVASARALALPPR